MENNIKSGGRDNPNFVDDAGNSKIAKLPQSHEGIDIEENTNSSGDNDRGNWGNGLEFLFSCIAMSVGLGNLWRFPFIAYENGGGAFLIPYIIVLFVIGKPGYFLEIILGQFSSRGAVKIYDLCPAMRGIGYGQVFAMVYVTSYYSSILGLALKYIYESLVNPTLPWSVCKDEWGSECISVSTNKSANFTFSKTLQSSSQLYYEKELLNITSLNDGIGNLNWNLVIFLAISWLIVFIILLKGVQSSGKISYVLAIFPYCVLFVILAKALTLEGAIDGVKYFFQPKWEKILEAKVWYEAVTQVFFSLGAYFGTVIIYSSYNKFDQKSHIDAQIVTTLDTFTSILAGSCVFAILGHLKHELGADDIKDVIRTGSGIAFISYPEAIARFENFSSLFAVLFFLMLYVLGVGSLVAFVSGIITSIRDKFQSVKNWQAALGVAIYGIISGSIYYTQSGQEILELVDYYGVTLVMFNLAVFEIFTFCYIYGVDKILEDVKFMMGFTPGMYWQICWRYLTPIFLFALLIYDYIAKLMSTDESSTKFPVEARIIGYCIATSALIHLPLNMIYAVTKSEGATWRQKILSAFSPSSSWGPMNAQLLSKYNGNFMTKL